MRIDEFLLARIAEDEADVAGHIFDYVEWDSGISKCRHPSHYSYMPTCWRAHVAPRVLAECAAKRAVVAEHNLVPQTYATSKRWDGPDVGCDVCSDSDGLIVGTGPCLTLLILAAVYADHPDFDPAWRLDVSPTT